LRSVGAITTASANPIIYGSAYNGQVSPASTLYSISPTNGVATPIGPIGFNHVGAIDFGPNGVLYGTGITTGGTNVLLRINTATGAGTVVGPTGLGAMDWFQDISFRPSDGTLFGLTGGLLYTLNITTGAATLVGNTGQFASSEGNGLAFSPTNILYHEENFFPGGTPQSLYTVNQSTAALTFVENLNTSAFPPPYFGEPPKVNGMDFDPLTGILWASVVTGTGPINGTNYLGTINIGTGVVSNIGTSIRGLDAIAVTNIPEPATWLLFGSGLAALGLNRRKRA
jgi:hypothetical protein